VGDALACIVHMSTGFSFGFSQAIVVMGDRAEHNRAIANGPSVSTIVAQAVRFADQGLADVDGMALPFDLAVLTHPPDFFMVAIVRLAQDTVEAPWRERIALGGRGIVERLVRPLFVVKTLE